MKINRIRCYRHPRSKSTFNQSETIITIETDEGVTGIGEGGTRDTIEQCAAMLIGEDPSRIQHLWQYLYRGFFYPAGREKLHAIGGIDLALWDMKGKSLGVPVYELLGGLTRDHVECYATGYPWQGSPGQTARACIQAGFRAFRTAVSDATDGVFNSHQMVTKTYEECCEVREGVGAEGDWAIDFHTRLDLPDAVRLAGLIEPLAPYFVEDPVRSENPGVLAAVRSQVKLPIAAGEQFGDRWDINELIERHFIDYTRVTLPNVGGITEFVKIAALCETHYVGMIPHFTGPISLASLTHVLGVFPGPTLMEVVGKGPALPGYLAAGFDFRNGKLWPRAEAGLGVEFDPAGAELIGEFTEHSAPIPVYRRPDGSLTNW